MGKNIMNSCPVCYSINHEFIVERKFNNTKSVWHHCLDCGSVFINPPPSNTELTKYYQNYLDKKSPGCVNHKFRFSDSNNEENYRMYKLSLNDIGIGFDELNGKTILDYGCANGVFLDLLNSNGCKKNDLYGFDISNNMINQVEKKGYSTQKFLKSNYFDYIFLWDVIEHIIEPHKIIVSIKLSLKPRGAVIIQTPCIGLLSNIFADKWEHLLPIEHVVLFSQSSLHNFMNNHGFREIVSKSFGANAPISIIPDPYKKAYDLLAKKTNNGSTQISVFELIGESK